MRKALYFFLSIGIIVILFSGTSGCATIIPPEGGPRDTIPPQLLNAEPDDSTLNFKGRRITLTFDEYVDVQDLSNNILFTPIFETNPEIRVRLRTITINFRDSLEPNTTYTLNFGNAIRDINENNIAKNFVYTFSTGPALDSLEFSGRVLLAETGRIDTTLSVVLYRNLNDSAVKKEAPRYVTRVRQDGSFRFTNLPAGVFKVYALGEYSRTRRYLSESQLFAFSNDSVIVGRTDSVILYAYRGTPDVLPGQNASPVQRNNALRENRLRFTTNLTAGKLELQKDLLLTFNTPLRNYDSANIALSTDSAFNPVNFTASLDTSRKRIQLTTQWKENTVYNLVLDRDFAEDTSGKKLFRTDTLNFSTKKLADYGKINIRIRNIDNSRKPVLQFVQNDQVVFSAPLSGGSFSTTLFTPGDYDLRILYDTNGNGKWDPGQFFGTKRQPELVQPIKEKITIKAAWDNEFERSL